MRRILLAVLGLGCSLAVLGCSLEDGVKDGVEGGVAAAVATLIQAPVDAFLAATFPG